MWIYLKDYPEVKKVVSGFRVQILNWDGEGWYYKSTYDKPCPRGCCRDSVVELTKANKRVKELQEQMRELAEELKFTKGKCKCG